MGSYLSRARLLPLFLFALHCTCSILSFVNWLLLSLLNTALFWGLIEQQENRYILFPQAFLKQSTVKHGSLSTSFFCLLVQLKKALIIGPRRRWMETPISWGYSLDFSQMFSLSLFKSVPNNATAQLLENQTSGEVVMCQVWSPVWREASWKSICRHSWVRFF